MKASVLVQWTNARDHVGSRPNPESSNAEPQ